MTTLQMDDNNNLVVENKNLQTATGITACAQDTRTRVGIVQGENPYDTEQGIAYFDDILGKLGGVEYLRLAITDRILDNPEIVGVSNLDISSSDNTTTVTADVETIYGVTQL